MYETNSIWNLIIFFIISRDTNFSRLSKYYMVFKTSVRNYPLFIITCMMLHHSCKMKIDIDMDDICINLQVFYCTWVNVSEELYVIHEMLWIFI